MNFSIRSFESFVGPHRLYVEGCEPADGPASEPAILFAGGAFDGSWIFRKQAEYLARHGWRVYALNPRGYYKSRWDNVAALTVEDYLEDIRVAREALKLDRVILGGYSMGGLLMLKHAERHGADALILYDSDPSLEIWKALRRPPHRGVIPPVVRFWPAPHIIREMWGGWVSRQRYLEFLNLFKQTAVSGRSYRLTEYGGLRVNTWKTQSPALVIGIRKDAAVQAEWFRRLNAAWLVFEGNSHGSILVGPRSKWITEEVGRWLETGFGVRQKRVFPSLGTDPHHPDLTHLRLRYFSGWQNPETEIRPPGKRPSIRVKMEQVGDGRVDGERLFRAVLTLHRRDGFFIRDGEHIDRPAGAGFYRPFARELYLADGEFFPHWPPAERAKPVYRDFEIDAPALQHRFKVHLLLPRNFRTGGVPYPVCVLNDGQNQWKNQGAFGGWHTDIATTDLIKKGRCREVILVTVESTRLNRNKYYLTPPVGHADLYVNFLADVLIPTLRKEYPISTRPEDIGIVGASYGANNAVYAGMKRPDVFGLVGSLSYAALKGRPLRSWMENLPRLPFRKIYVDCGTKWTPDQKGHRTDNTRTTQDLIRIAQSKGLISGRTLLWQICQRHCHQEPFWRKRIGRCMEFLFGLV